MLGGDSSPGPTMVNLPPPQNNVSGGSGSSGNNDNIAAALSSAPPPPAPSSGAGSGGGSTSTSNRWSVMGGMAGSFVTSARGVVSTAAATVTKQGGDGEAGYNYNAATASTSNNDNAATQQQQQQGSTSVAASSIKSPPSSGNAFFSNLTSNITSGVNQLNSSVTQLNTNPLQSFTKSLSNNITGKNTLPDKTTASQVLMFRQLLHTKCRPGLRLSRNYEGTAAQMAVLHMPWWERGIEQSKKMIISYDNLITRLWLSGAIMPFESGGYASIDGIYKDTEKKTGTIDTLINERGLPPVPHSYWVDRLGFQQDDPVTDFRSGGVLSLAMLVHMVESCPSVHSRFVPKPKSEEGTSLSSEGDVISLEEIITDDASVLPFGITCINITDMLAKFLLFSRAIDKMDALLSAKPFWKMFIDPNAMLVLQEVSLDLLCDVCVEIGRERRIKKLTTKYGNEGEHKNEGGMPGSRDGKVTVFDFSEIMERTEKRVGDEVLGAGPQNVDELRAIARRVKSKYLMRIQLKEKHLINPTSVSPLAKQIPPIPSKESMKNVTNSVIGGVGGFVSMLKMNPSSRGAGSSSGDAEKNNNDKEVVPSKDIMNFTSPRKSSSEPAPLPGGQEVEVHLDGTTSTPSFGSPKSPVNPFASSATSPNDAMTSAAGGDEDDELEKLSAELGELSAATAEAFDLLGDDFGSLPNMDDVHSEELLDAMDEKVDPLAAFAIDDNDFLS